MKLKHLLILLLLSTQTVLAYTPKTKVSVSGDKFCINGKTTFEGKTWRGHSIEGLLPNSRMINGIFDDLNPETQNRWAYQDTKKWDADRNTKEFVAAMPQWKEHGLLAFTIGLQGGSPLGYSNSQPWINSAFTPKGELRPEYMKRLQKTIDKADKLGMVVILDIFYWGQDERLDDEAAVVAAVSNTVDWVIKRGYKNVVFEVVNESDNKYDHEILKPQRVCELIKFIQSKSFLASTSFNGRVVPPKEVIECADFILLHGNGAKSPDVIKEQMQKTKALLGDTKKPLIYNEDDHFDFDKPMNNFVMATSMGVSWGYFDYRMKGETAFEEGYQSMPCDWRINSDRKRGFFGLLKEWTK